MDPNGVEGAGETGLNRVLRYVPVHDWEGQSEPSQGVLNVAGRGATRVCAVVADLLSGADGLELLVDEMGRPQFGGVFHRGGGWLWVGQE